MNYKPAKFCLLMPTKAITILGSKVRIVILGAAIITKLAGSRFLDAQNDIALIGHSEGAVIVPRIASKHPQDVKNVVLLGASSQTLYDLVVEKTNRTILLARNYWDDDKDGRLSLEEVIIHSEAGLTIPNASSSSGDNLSGQQWSVVDMTILLLACLFLLF